MYQSIEALIKNLEADLKKEGNGHDFKFALKSTLSWLKMLKRFY